MTGEYLALCCSTAGDGDAGVYGYGFDPETGVLTDRGATPFEKPTFLATGPEGRRAYVAERAGDGRVIAVAVDHAEGTVARLDDRSSGGVGPCYVSVDGPGRFAFVANYGGGTVAMYPIGPDGGLGPVCDVVAHEGSGADPDRQAAPHPHAAVPGPDDRFLYAPDLGTDRVEQYRIDADGPGLDLVERGGAALPPGTGPRHLVFGPDGQRASLVGELDSTVTVLARDPDTGTLDPQASVSTLPPGADASGNAPADVHVHPSGRWAFVSNRGHESIATFRVDERGGESGTEGPSGRRHAGPEPELELVDAAAIGGENPREFALDPTGSVLLAGNRDSDAVVSFRVGDDGRLTELTRRGVPKPTCLAFVGDH